jgi:hypothetical protein
MFAGLVVLMHLDGIVPRSGQTALSQLAHRSFGSGPLYVYVQAATALVLLFAANTSFNGFPRLLSIMARNGHAPRLFLRLGDRLAFSNGTIALAVAAAVLFVAFAGRTSALIPLYAVGVFVAFTFSQVGMVVHWWRLRDEHWRKSMLLNGVGAALSAIVFVIAAVTKFSHGAWVAMLLIALLALLAWRIRRHYDSVHRALALYSLDESTPDHRLVPTRLSAPHGSNPDLMPRAEDDESPDQLQHLAVVPIVRLDLSSLRALAYAASLGQPVLTVHISPGDDEAARFKSYWGCVGRSPAARGGRLPLSGARRAARVLHRRAAHPATRPYADRRPARDHRQAPLAAAPAQRHRASTATRPATPTGSRHHHHPASPGNLTAAAWDVTLERSGQLGTANRGAGGSRRRLRRAASAPPSDRRPRSPAARRSQTGA